MSGRPEPTVIPLVEVLLDDLADRGITVEMTGDGKYAITPAGVLTADERRLLVRYRGPMRRFWQKAEGCAVCGCPSSLYDEHGRPACVECAAELPDLVYAPQEDAR